MLQLTFYLSIKPLRAVPGARGLKVKVKSIWHRVLEFNQCSVHWLGKWREMRKRASDSMANLMSLWYNWVWCGEASAASESCEYQSVLHRILPSFLWWQLVRSGKLKWTTLEWWQKYADFHSSWHEIFRWSTEAISWWSIWLCHFAGGSVCLCVLYVGSKWRHEVETKTGLRESCNKSLGPVSQVSWKPCIKNRHWESFHSSCSWKPALEISVYTVKLTN